MTGHEHELDEGWSVQDPSADPLKLVESFVDDAQHHAGIYSIVVYDPAVDVAAVAADITLDERGRFRLANLLVVPVAGVHVDTELWRRVPLAKIETILNDPLRRPWDLEWIESYKGHPGHRMTTFKDLDDLYRSTQKRARKRTPPLNLGPLPSGPKYPDSFYRRVAAAYTRLAHEGRGPGTTLSEINGVPTTTVNRWVKEARRRKLLAPAGAKGRVG